MQRRGAGFYFLAAFFVLFVMFLYGPTITIAILSFQGPQGGLTFPMNGVSVHWFHNLFEQQAVGDIWGSFRRSFTLGLMVMVTTVIVSVMAGLAFRRKFIGSTLIFYMVIGSLIIPSILISLGVGILFNQLDWDVHWSTSGLGSQLDLGASNWQTVWHIVVPLIAPSLIGVALFGFTLSYDEFARTLLTAGSYNTLPLEIYGMTTSVTTPVLYALGTLTTIFSFIVIGCFIAIVWLLERRRTKMTRLTTPD